MSSSRWSNVRELFERASELPTSHRGEFLRTVCADSRVRNEVESLLSSSEDSPEFLSKPAGNIAELLGSVGRGGEEALVGQRLGRYEIEAVIGAGGMGVVYRAQQDNPRRTVAIKVIRSWLLPRELQRRFRYEAAALGRLKHPGIAQVLEASAAVGPDGKEIPFLAMEYVVGRPLLAHVAAQGVGLRDRLELFASVCDAVQHAHERGVIHRDLKPQNVLVEDVSADSTHTTSPRWQPKVLDFGVARLTDRSGVEQTMTTSRTDVGQIIGTIAYMSPEQARGDQQLVDTRSDIYSLGAIMYELLTGALPHDVRSLGLLEASRRINETDPVPPSRITPALRGDVETIVLKALEKEPERRYSSAAELAADVRRYLADMPITARPSTAVYHMRKFARRNRGLVAASALAMLTLLGGVVGTSIGLVRARDARARAENREQLAKDEARKADRVVRFLADVLGSTGSESLRADVTLQETLEEAMVRVDRELGNEPAVSAFVRERLGASFLRLGELTKARPNVEKALTEWLEVSGPDSPEAARMYGLLGSVASSDNNFDEAVRWWRKQIQTIEKIKGSDHPDVAAVLVDVGGALVVLDRLDEAGESLTRALAIYDRVGEQGGQRQKALAGMARVYAATGKPERAEPLFKDAIDFVAARYGPTDPFIASTLMQLARAQAQMGRAREAIESLTRAAEIRAKIYGPAHTRTLATLLMLSQMYIDTGRPREALPVMERVVTERRRVLTPDHPELATALTTLGSVYSRLGNDRAAESAYREALDVRRRRLTGGKVLASAIVNLGSVVQRQGRYAESATLLEEASRMRLGMHDDSLSGSFCYALLAEALLALGRGEEAAAWAAHAVSSSEQNAWGEARHISDLVLSARCITEPSRTGEREELLRLAIVLADRNSSDAVRTVRSRAVELLASTLENDRRAEEAAIVRGME